jgi:hypothetical protein
MQRSHLFFSMSATKFATIFEQARTAADESAMVVASTQPLKCAQLRRGERFALSSGGQFWGKATEAILQTKFVMSNSRVSGRVLHLSLALRFP